MSALSPAQSDEVPALAARSAQKASATLAGLCCVGPCHARHLRADRHVELVQLDDPDLVTVNPHVQRGLRDESIHRAFGEFYMGFWIPATWLSLMLDVTLFGPGAAGAHVVKAVLHSVNGAMPFLAMRALTKSFWASAFIAAIVHGNRCGQRR
jgi:hypothetical protein